MSHNKIEKTNQTKRENIVFVFFSMFLYKRIKIRDILFISFLIIVPYSSSPISSTIFSKEIWSNIVRSCPFHALFSRYTKTGRALQKPPIFVHLQYLYFKKSSICLNNVNTSLLVWIFIGSALSINHLNKKISICFFQKSVQSWL